MNVNQIFFISNTPLQLGAISLPKTGNSKATVQTAASRYTAEDYSFIGNEIKTDKRCSIGASFYCIIVIITIFLDNITLTKYNLY